MERDHPLLVQHSKFHTQAGRASGDISLLIGTSDPTNPSVDDISVEKYICGYACTGGGATLDLLNDMINVADETTGATGKTL